MFWSLPHEAVMSSTASFLRASRSLSTPWIMSSGISITRISAPTPKSFRMVVGRLLKKGCDFGSGGGASGIGTRLMKFGSVEQQQYEAGLPSCGSSYFVMLSEAKHL